MWKSYSKWWTVSGSKFSDAMGPNEISGPNVKPFCGVGAFLHISYIGMKITKTCCRRTLSPQFDHMVIDLKQ